MFCKTCGKELNNNAVICTECGCATDNFQNNAHPTPQSKTLNDTSGLSKNLGTLALIFALASLFSLLVIDYFALICAYIMSIILITASFVLSGVCLKKADSTYSKWLGIITIIINGCAFVCILVHFICFMSGSINIFWILNNLYFRSSY